MALAEQFELKPSMRFLLKSAPYQILVLALLFAIPFFQKVSSQNQSAWLVFAVIIFLVLGPGGWYAWKTLKEIPGMAISVDDDGVWPTVLSKHAALVPWSRIVRLKEHQMSQCLEALDSKGAVVIRFEYGLQNFERLRALILERAQLVQPTLSASSVYQAGLWYHVVTWVFIPFFLGAIWYAKQQLSAFQLLMSVGVVLYGMYEYATAPYKLHITPEALEISTPIKWRRVPRSSIAQLEIDDHVTSPNGYAVLKKMIRHPKLLIYLSDHSKPIRLKALKVKATELYQVLEAWRKNTV